MCEIGKWVTDALKNENLKKIDVKIIGTGAKCDGYVGDITFVHVSATNPNGLIQEYDLVLKHGKKNEVLRQNIPIHLAFEREIFVYNQAFPAFQKFQKEKNLKPIDFIPKCFKTFLYEKDEECVVLQNLKKIGYDLHDRCVPMDKNHLKLTLEAYGRLHALSFAFRDQRTEEFNQLFDNLKPVLKEFLLSEQMKPPLENVETNVCDILQDREEFSLLEKYKEEIKDGVTNTLVRLITLKDKNSVLTHGDCWNNNFMFIYKDINGKMTPTKVALLDFQLSQMASPVLDLSYHIYSVCSEAELQDFEELLNVYYSALSNSLKKLGSDPDKVFPFSLLVEHWKTFSVVGLIMSCIALPFVMTDKEDAISLEQIDKKGFGEFVGKLKGEHKENFQSRITSSLRHFFEYKFKTSNGKLD